MKKFILAMLLMALFVSCDLLDLDTDGGTSVGGTSDDDTPLTPLEPDQFYAVNFTNDRFYKVRAEMLHEGTKCIIWAEKGSGVTKKKAQEIAAEYDNNIRQKIVDTFGMKSFEVNDGASLYQFEDILDFANWLVDKEDKKLTILLLDIKDVFNGTTNRAYVAGYFYSGNFYSKGPIKNSANKIIGYSNSCDMIYVDTYPSLDSTLVEPKQTFTTFAHELQHLINFTTTVLKRERVMDTWIDEGLSSQAEQIYLDKNLVDRCEQFSKDDKGTIAKGNNFFVWDNHPEEKMAILDEYSTVYLFFRWLFLQAQAKNLHSNIFLKIETSDKSDHTIITDVAKGINSEWSNWETLLSTWLAANYYPANSVYGYKNDSYFQTNIKVKTLTTKSAPLYPGEGVYSNINTSFTTPSTSGTNIRYAGLSSTSSNIVAGPTFTSPSNILLTFNANTNNKARAETGSLTGVSASVSSTPNSRSLMAEDTQAYNGPYAIDARDYSRIFGRNK
jgi:hypothetical protein